MLSQEIVKKADSGLHPRSTKTKPLRKGSRNNILSELLGN